MPDEKDPFKKPEKIVDIKKAKENLLARKGAKDSENREKGGAEGGLSHKDEIAEGDKDYQSAISDCEEALKQNPNDTYLLINLGNVYLRGGEPGKAKEYYLRATEINPDSSLAFCDLGIACEDLDQISEAINNYEIATLLEPVHVDAYLNLALLLEKNNPFQALSCLNKYLENSKNISDSEKEDILKVIAQIKERLSPGAPEKK